MKYPFIFLLAFILGPLIASTQETRHINPRIYRNYIDRNAAVKIQTIDRGRVSSTDTSRLDAAMVRVDQKTVVSYDQKILAIDRESFQKLNGDSLGFTADQIKIIPELHVETLAGQVEALAYRIVFTSQQPLEYNEELKKFNARLGFFLLPESGSNATIKESINIEVVANEAQSVKPASFPITHLNLPPANVELIAEHVNDSTVVKVITASRPEGYITYLKVKPALELSTNRTSVQGWGIQKFPVTVRLLGSNSPDSVKVIFNPGKGTVEPEFLYVQYNKPATVYVRSEGTGDCKLTATGAAIRSNEINVQFVFPWLFLGAALLGGIAGSFAKYLKEKESTTKLIIAAILAGIIGAAAYYGLGVNLLGISLSAGLNELAVFALSALCAYFGISLTKKS